MKVRARSELTRADLAWMYDVVRHKPHSIHHHPLWYEEYLATLQPRLLVLEVVDRCSGQRVGLVPFEVAEFTGTRLWRNRRLVPLGAGPSDFFHLPIAEHAVFHVATALVGWFTRNSHRWEELRIFPVPQGGVGVSEITTEFRRLGFPAELDTSRRCLFVETTGAWEPYEARVLRPRTRDVRNRANRMARAGITPEFEDGIQEVGPYLEGLFEAYRERRRRRGQRSATGEGAPAEFFRKAVTRLAREGKVVMSLLRAGAGGPIMAYQLDFLDQGVRYHSHPAFVEEFAEYSPSHQLLIRVLKSCFANPQIVEFNFMRGESDYKRRYANGSWRFWSLTVVNVRSPRARAAAAVRSLLRRGRNRDSSASGKGAVPK